MLKNPLTPGGPPKPGFRVHPDVLKLGLLAVLDADSVTGAHYTGKVTFIASSATVVGNARTYVVRITLDKQDGLRPGMRVRALIGKN